MSEAARVAAGMYPEDEEDDSSNESSKKSSEESSDLLDTVKSQPGVEKSANVLAPLQPGTMSALNSVIFSQSRIARGPEDLVLRVLLKEQSDDLHCFSIHIDCF